MFRSIIKLFRVLAGTLLATFLITSALSPKWALAVDEVIYIGQVLEVNKDHVLVQVVGPSCKGKRDFRIGPGNSLSPGETIKFTFEDKEEGEKGGPCSDGALILLSPVGR